jgi:hypothetical protein
MRLIQYINEEKSFNEWAPIIKKDCSKFIKDIKGSKGTLNRIDSYLGGNDRKNAVIKKKTRNNRRIMDTSKEISIEIDNLFKKKFGWKARTENVVFCWGIPFSSPEINSGFLIFPAGNYKYLWSPEVNDLYNIFHYALDFPKENQLDKFKELFLNSYTNKNIKKAVVSFNEIMVGCNYYYMIRPELIERVNQEFNLNWQGAKFTGRKLT